MPIFAFGAGGEDVGWDMFQNAFFSSELQIIEEKMKDLNPTLVEQVANDDDRLKIVKYNNWWAKHIFDEYKDYALWALQQKSDATGRAVKLSTKVLNNGAHEYIYWLDRGIMDSDECNGGFNDPEYQPQEDSCAEIERSLEFERNHLCLYPDGFEEETVEITEDGDHYSSISVKEESARNNISRDVYVSLDAKSSVQTNGAAVFISLGGVYNLRPWQKAQEFRNWVVQDIKDGMLECKPAEINGCQSDEPGVFCSSIGIKGNIEDWRSSKDYIGEVGNFSIYYEYDHIHN